MSQEFAQDLLWNGPLAGIFAGRYELIFAAWLVIFFAMVRRPRRTRRELLLSVYIALLVMPIVIGLFFPGGPVFPYIWGHYEGGLATILDGGRSIGAIAGYFLFVAPFTLVNVAMLLADTIQYARGKQIKLLVGRVVILIAALAANEVWRVIAFGPSGGEYAE